VLSARSDGSWELLAAPAGSTDALAEVLRGLSRTELDRGALGLALAPSIVRDRVEAVASRDHRLLADLAATWARPVEIGDHQWWLAAWGSSIRHLQELGAITRDEVDVPELAPEVELVWGESPRAAISWRRFAAEKRARFVPYDSIRAAGNAEIEEDTLTAADLEGTSPLLLRALRGRSSRLDDSARAALAAWADEALDRDPFEAALILELCDELSLAVAETVRERLVDRAEHLDDPRAIIPLAYVALGNWVVP
jgi:hypothetical protein